jgi:antitoxin (DNA-binding transcriptional repressor) of toxin-antitoxin stability system
MKPPRIDHTLSIEDTRALLGQHDPKVITRTEPLARLVPLTAPQGETEAEFWHRKAQERSRRINELERVVRNLRLGLAAAMEEVQRLQEELDS